MGILIFILILVLISFYIGTKVEEQRWINNSSYTNKLLEINNHLYKVIKDENAKQHICSLRKEFISIEEIDKENDELINKMWNENE